MFSTEKILTLLPIGSVVKLQQGKHPLMVVGVCQTNADNPEETADYLGVAYPEGYLGTGSQFFFQHESIETVLFEGYRTPEQQALLARIAKYYEQNH